MNDDIYKMNPTPEEFSRIASDILQSGDQTPDYEALQYYHEELATSILNWMGQGDSERVEGLLGQLRKAISKSQAGGDSLKDLPPKLRFESQIRTYCHFLSVFLRTSNSTKLMGLLAGKRNEERRMIFLWIAAEERPITKSMVQEQFGLKKSTAKAAVDKFHALGLLSKNNQKYSISWHGRQYADYLGSSSITAEQEKENLPEDHIDSALPLSIESLMAYVKEHAIAAAIETSEKIVRSSLAEPSGMIARDSIPSYPEVHPNKEELRAKRLKLAAWQKKSLKGKLPMVAYTPMLAYVTTPESEKPLNKSDRRNTVTLYRKVAASSPVSAEETAKVGIIQDLLSGKFKVQDVSRRHDVPLSTVKTLKREFSQNVPHFLSLLED